MPRVISGNASACPGVRPLFVSHDIPRLTSLSPPDVFGAYLQDGLDPLSEELLDQMHPVFTPPVLGSLSSRIGQASQYATHALALASQQEVARRQVFNALRHLLVYAESQDRRLERIELLLRRVAACPPPDPSASGEPANALVDLFRTFANSAVPEPRFDYAGTLGSICGALLSASPPGQASVPSSAPPTAHVPAAVASPLSPVPVAPSVPVNLSFSPPPAIASLPDDF